MLLNKISNNKFLVPLINLFGGVLIIIFFVFLEFSSLEELQRSQLFNASKSYASQQNQRLHQYIRHGDQVILSLRSSSDFIDYLGSNKTKDVRKLFKYAMNAEPYVMQLRFIDNKGMERIRFDRKTIDEQAFEVRDSKLQNKAHRDYVQENIGKPESIWYSKLDLNIEHGEVELPFKPTFRTVLPVWHHKEFKGMIVINYYAQPMLDSIFLLKDYKIRVVDKRGYILFSSDKTEEWSEFSHTPFTIDATLVKQLSQDNVITKTSALLPVDTPFLNPLWLYLEPSKAYLKHEAELRENNLIILSLIVFCVNLLFSGLIYLVMRSLNLQLENEREKRELRKRLSDKQEKILSISSALDKYVITSNTDLQGIITYASQAFCDISGYSKEELIGASHRLVRHSDMPPELYRDLWKTIQEDKTWRGEIKNRCKNGDYYWVHASISPLYDKDGVKIGYTAVRENITDKKATEENEKALKTLSLRTTLALEAGKVGVWEWNYAANTLIWDERMYEIYGIDPSHEENPYEMWRDMVDPDEIEKVEKNLNDAIQNNNDYNMKFWIITPTQEKRYIHAIGKNEFGKDGRAYRMIGINIDITRQKMVEDHLQELVQEETAKRLEQSKLMVQQSKLAAMGEMMANIAHQWKQPLMMLSMGVLVLQKKFKKGELNDQIMDDYVSKANEITTKMNQTILDFSEYFTPNKPAQTFKLSDSINTSIKFLEPLIKKNSIEIVKKILAPHCEIHGPQNELSQVFFNLIHNSIDAIVHNKIEKGLITITLKESKEHLFIQVSDNGGGIPENILDQVFVPYFTTKFKNNGTGIGLYMSKMIVEQSLQGTLLVRNSDAGAEFTIQLSKGK